MSLLRVLYANKIVAFSGARILCCVNSFPCGYNSSEVLGFDTKSSLYCSRC